MRSFDSIAIRVARPADAGPVAGTLGTAFAGGPVAEWLIPDALQRLLAFRAYSRSLYDGAIAHGTVHTADAYIGAAVWCPHDAPPATGGAPESLVDSSVIARFAALDEAIARLAPSAPHHHLAFLGVYPTVQRMGVGSALLRHHHHHLDGIGVPAFLVATSPGSRDLYRRHGYAVRTEAALPSGPLLWAMWRAPGER